MRGGDASALSGGGNPSVLAVIVRWWRYLALGVLIGAFGLAVIVLRPATAMLDDGDAAWRRATRLLRPWVFGGLVAFVLAHLATLIVQAATVADFPHPPGARRHAAPPAYNTTYGAVWRMIAVVALLLLLGMLVTLLPFWQAAAAALGVIATARPARARTRSSRPSTLRHVAIGLGASRSSAVVLTFSSHAIESQHQPVLALLADAAHLSAMGLWFGGLLVLLLTLAAGFARSRARSSTALSGRDGAALLEPRARLRRLPHRDGPLRDDAAYDAGTILTTSYGQTLLIKHALILPLIATAALNLRVIKPRLGDRSGHAAGCRASSRSRRRSVSPCCSSPRRSRNCRPRTC